MKQIILVLICVTTLLCSCKKDKTNDMPVVIADSLLYQTDFSTNDGSWPTLNFSTFSTGYVNGKYQIEIDSVNVLKEITAPYTAINSQYSFSADCTLQVDDITKSGSVGLVYNKVGNDLMLLRIFNDGSYIVYEIHNGSPSQLIAKTASSDIKTNAGDVNNLKVVQTYNTTKFYINSKIQNSISYNELTGNVQVGVFSSTDPGIYTRVVGTFDNINISKVF